MALRCQRPNSFKQDIAKKNNVQTWKKDASRRHTKESQKSSNWKMLVLIPLLLILTIPFAFADERDSGIRHVKCVDLQKSILETEFFETSEFDFSLILSIEQNDGKCVMKNKLGKTYLVSWMPAYHKVNLIDTDFGQISSQRLMIPDEQEEIIFDLHKEIPYCFEVVSVWLDNRVRSESTSEICIQKNLL